MGHFLVKTMTNVVVGKAADAAKAAVVGATTNMIAKVLGLDDTLVGRVLMVGLPMMVFAGAEDEGIAGRLFGDSKKKDRKKDKSRKEAEDDYFRVFGDKGHKMNKAIANATGAKEEEVDGIMGMFLPTFEDAIAEEEVEDAGMLQKMFRSEADDAKRKSPSFARMAMKAIF
ncbi:MAG: hypothetical protein ACK2UO_17620 [Caldilineaceae bacterium]|jgi:hypothetical protein